MWAIGLGFFANGIKQLKSQRSLFSPSHCVPRQDACAEAKTKLSVLSFSPRHTKNNAAPFLPSGQVLKQYPPCGRVGKVLHLDQLCPQTTSMGIV